MNPLHRTQTDPVKTASDRSFGLVMAGFFALVAGWPLFSGAGLRWWALVIAALFALAALLRSSLLAPLNRLWTRLGLVMHRIVNPLVLGLIFVLTIVPTGLVMRLMGKDPLRLKRDASATTYWIERQPPGPAPESLPRQF